MFSGSQDQRFFGRLRQQSASVHCLYRSSSTNDSMPLTALTTYPTSVALNFTHLSVLDASTPAFLTTLASILNTILNTALRLLVKILIPILFLAYHTFRLSRLHLLLPLAELSSSYAKAASKAVYKFRQDCFWHFMVWILNPYALWLFIFWPGWIVLGVLWIWISW